MNSQHLDINKTVARRPRVQKKRARRALKAMLLTMAAVLTIAGVAYCGHLLLKRFLQHPDFTIRKVCVVNNRTIDPNHIIRIAGIRTNMNIYATSLAPIARRLEQHPDIRTTKITKRHPDMLVIKVIEREPIAIIVTSGTQDDIPVDADGVMLSEHKMEYALHLPKIVGLRHVRYQPGAVVKDPRVPVALQFVDTLRHVRRNTFIDVRKIHFDEPNDIILESASVDKIRIGVEYSHEQVLRLIRVVNELRFQRINADKIDLRFANVAVTPRLL